jgi:localization factor PodJL
VGKDKYKLIVAARRAAQFAAETQSGEPAGRADAGTGITAAAAGSRGLARYIKPLLIGVSLVVILAYAINLAIDHFTAGGTTVELPKEAPKLEAPKPQSKAPTPNAIARMAPPVGELGSGNVMDAADAANGGSGVLTAPMPTPLPPTVSVAPPSAPPAPHIAAPQSIPASVPSPPAPPMSIAPGVVAAPPATTGSIGPRKLTPPPAGLFTSPPPARAAALPPAIGGRVLISAAEGGDPGAAYEVAIRFAEGHGVAANPEETAIWFERAARAGMTPALFRLGGLYEKGIGVKKDLNRARALYSEAAERGHAKAMHNLAVLYAEGVDGKPDYPNAVQWFRKAASRGVADSQFNLGVLYARGIGMEQNLAEAYKWFALAAQSGDQDAAQKRDDVGKRLDAQTAEAVRVTVQKWTPEPQSDTALGVMAPPGGWDQAVPSTGGKPAPAKAKSKRV